MTECEMCIVIQKENNFQIKVKTIINNKITTMTDSSNYFYNVLTLPGSVLSTHKFYSYLYQYILDSQ